jgi:predicted RNA-binding Zn-ribbon protein involved in translation (DUF1610 family)
MKCGGEMKGGAKFCKSCGSGVENGMHDEKKARVLAGEKKNPKTPIIISAAFAVVVAGWLIYNNTSGARSMDRLMQGQAAPAREGNKHLRYTPVAAENGEVKVRLSSLQGSTASYFVYHANGKDVKFFVLKASDGTVRIALDACTACNHAKLGYRQNGEAMVCNNCGMSFRSTDVGRISGGCSPIPLQNSQDGTTLTVKAKDLDEGAKYF